MSSHQKTFEVAHPGAHQPTDEQLKAALKDALSGSDVKPSGEVTFHSKVNVSGSTSTYVATYEEADEDETPKPVRAKRA